MSSTTRRRLALPALVLAAGLTLAACGDGTDTDSTGSSSDRHGGGHADGSRGEVGGEGNAADVEFLTGMRPHHEQAVEMSDIVLASDPPAEVAAMANEVKDAQEPEIQQMETLLAEVGEQTDGGAHEGHSVRHGGMLSVAGLAELEAARGTEAAELYLGAMIAHHEGAVEAAEAEIANGQYGPAVALAKQIATAQRAEITELQVLLQAL